MPYRLYYILSTILLFCPFVHSTPPIFTKCQNTQSLNDLKRVIWHNGTFYAVGDSSTIVRSIDGLEWAKENVHSSDCFLMGIAGNGYELIASGGKYGSFTYNKDFNNWITLQTDELYHGFPSVVSTGRDSPKFLAAGDYRSIKKSNSFIDFTPCQVTGTISDVAAGNTFYGLAIDNHGKKAMAVGFRGLAAFSNDSTFTNWSLFRIDSTIDMYNVRFFDGQFIAAGTKGTIIKFYSDTACALIKIDSIAWLTDICKIKNGFIAVEYNARSRIFHSTDLLNWMAIDSAEYGLSSIAQSEDSSVIVITGNYGTILRGVFDASASSNKSINSTSKKVMKPNGNCSSIHSSNVYDILGKQIYTTGFRNGHSNNLLTAAGIRIINSNTDKTGLLKKEMRF